MIESFNQIFNQIIYREIFSVTLILFSVIDILGSIPFVIDMQHRFGHINSFKITTVSGFFLFLFLFVGDSILSLFSVDVESFAVAGGVIMLLLGFEMVLNIEIFKHDPQLTNKKSPIVPLAFPLIAGAGSMTTLISLNAEYQKINIVLGILLNLVVVYLVLKSSKFISKALGITGSIILRKFFGTILIAMAIKLIKKNFISIY